MLAAWRFAAMLALDLTWEAPPGCPPMPVVREEIEAAITPEHRGADLRVRGFIEERAPRHWVLTLETIVEASAPDRRVIEGESCDAVTRAGILVVSLRQRGEGEGSSVVPPPPRPEKDPGAGGPTQGSAEPVRGAGGSTGRRTRARGPAGPSASPGGVAGPEGPGQPDGSAASAGPASAARPAGSPASGGSASADRPAGPSEAERTGDSAALEPAGTAHNRSVALWEARRARSWHAMEGWLSAAGGAAYGALPGWGGAVRLEGGIEGRRWRAGLGVQTLPLRRFEDEGVAARFDLLAATASGCLVLHAGPVEFPLCGRFSAGGLRGQGLPPLPDARTTWSPWVGLGAEVGAAWFVHRHVAVLAAAEGLGVLARPQFVAGNPPDPLWRPGPGGFRGWLGLEFHGPFRSRKRPPG